MTRYLIALCIVTILSPLITAGTPGLMNYQGRLTTSGGTPVADGNYSVVFTIYDASSGGAIKWTETQTVTTSGGLFAVLLGSVSPVADSVFNGATRYLGTKVGADPEMSPRVTLVTVPYAFRVQTVDGASGGNISSKVSVGPGHTNTGLNAFVAGASNVVTGNYSSTGGGENHSASGDHATIGGGHTNAANGSHSTVAGGDANTASSDFSTVGGGTSNTGNNTHATIGGGAWNTAGGQYSTIPGGHTNAALGNHSTVGGGEADTASGDHATVGGGHTNKASGFHSTIAGGDANTASWFFSTVGGGTSNTASNTHATIGGGAWNTASGQYSTVPGGHGNSASGYHSTVGGGEADTASGDHATVGGGHTNKASGFHSTIAGGDANTAIWDFSTVGGGTSNIASNTHATIGGGAWNTASGQYSTVPGGYVNVAAGTYSLAAGRRAKANHPGTFVWADSTDVDFASTATNQFLIRAKGGVGIGTTSPDAGLHVKGAGFPMAFGYFDTDAGSQDAGLRFYEAGVTKSHVYHQANTNTLNLYGEGFSGISVNSSGNVGIGTTSPTAKLHVVGNICYTGSIGACSDARYKKDVATLNSSLEILMQLRGVTYCWKKEEYSNLGFDDQTHIGFIAQEVEALYPDMVITDSAGYKSVDYGRLTPVLVEAIKDQQKTIDSMAIRLQALEIRISGLVEDNREGRPQLSRK